MRVSLDQKRWDALLARQGLADNGTFDRLAARHFLAMPRIYKTGALAAEWEAPARENLAAELQTLAK